MEAVHVVGWGVLPGEEGEVEVTAGRRDVGQLPATEPTDERALSGVTIVYLHVVVLAVITEVGRKVKVITGLTNKGLVLSNSMALDPLIRQGDRTLS